MSAPELLTPRERQLLAAVRELLDIPQPADYRGREGYQDDLANRAAWLCGYLRDDDELSLDRSRAAVMIASIRKQSARPLGYEHAASEYSA